LNDYERFVQVFELRAPEGYSDIGSFNSDLAVHLQSLHNDRRENIDQTLRGGTQTMGDLFRKDHRLIALLRSTIERSVAEYIARMKHDDIHPLLSRKADNFGYAGSWSTRLRDCGFHTNHYHGKGWISSAYYVSVPDAAADVDSQQGWIKFGEPSFDVGSSGYPRRTIQPRSGTLVLFPSYMWHGTIPFRSESERLTVAFDVVPKPR
jgi:hypothetical protein